MTLSLRLLQRFDAVVEAGSIGMAAQALRIPQQQISRQIVTLEGMVGTPLFLFHPHEVSPTLAALALCDRCLPICERATALMRSGDRRFVEGLNRTRLG